MTKIKQKISILEKRKMQAEVIKPIYKEMVSSIGEAKAKEILKNSIIKSAVNEGKSLRKLSDKKNDSLSVIDQFIDVFENWKTGGALEIKELKKSHSDYYFDVTRCKYAEMYEEMGLKNIGDLLSCNRDGSFSKGFDPNLTLERNETIMKGANCCTFRYRYKEK